MFVFEPRSAGDETVESDNGAPQVKDSLSHREFGSLMQRDQLCQYLVVRLCSEWVGYAVIECVMQ